MTSMEDMLQVTDVKAPDQPELKLKLNSWKQFLGLIKQKYLFPIECCYASGTVSLFFYMTVRFI